MSRPPTKRSLRNKADSLVQEYIKLKYLYCLVCAEPINCGHHFVPKARSNTLRYYLPNIVPVCKTCHCLVHNQPYLVEPKICFLMGKEWHDDLMEVKKEHIRENILWYKSHIEVLQEQLKNLKEEQDDVLA